MVELPDFLFYAGLVVMLGLIVQNIWKHRLYNKAVNELVDQDEEIADLKTQLLEKDKLVETKDVLYNLSVFGSGINNPSSLLGKTVRFQGIDYHCNEIKIYQKQWRNNSYSQLDEAIQNANLVLTRWENWEYGDRRNFGEDDYEWGRPWL